MRVLGVIYKNFIGLSLKRKLILISALQIFIPVILVGYFSNIIATGVLKDKISDSTIIALEQSAKSIEMLINDIEDLSLFIVSEDSVQKLLKKTNENDREGAVLLDSVYKTLLNLTNSKKYMSLIYIYKESNKRQFYVGPPVLVGEDSLSKQQWYKKALELDGKSLWVDTYKNTFFSGNDPYIFTLARTINDMYNLKKRLGTLLINIDENSLYQYYHSQPLGADREVFIINGNGTIVSHKDKNMISMKADDYLMENGVIQGDKGAFTYKNNIDNTMVTYYRIPKLDWILVSTVSMEELMKENRTISQLTLAVVIVSIIITFFISIFVSSTISKPVGKLLQQMKKVSDGNFDIHVDFNYGDEISQLGGGFKSMVSKIELLMKQFYLDQKKQKEIELKALQAQINPHFLYNTLESINWMAQEIKATEISTMVQSLAKFFRISISKGKDMISVKDEIEHVKNYLIIQKIRYKEVLNADINVDEDILSYKVPKLILQPLVENAIYHGIKKKKHMGRIVITGYKDENDIHFEIIDNGVGIEKSEIERLNSLLKNPISEVKVGYGISNVNERIALRFGREYGLTYSNNEVSGTKVSIRLPACVETEG